MLGTIAKKLRIFGFDCKYHITESGNTKVESP